MLSLAVFLLPLTLGTLKAHLIEIGRYVFSLGLLELFKSFQQCGEELLTE